MLKAETQCAAAGWVVFSYCHITTHSDSAQLFAAAYLQLVTTGSQRDCRSQSLFLASSE